MPHARSHRLLPPALPDGVTRLERVLDLVDSAGPERVVALCAPVGFGATTAAVQAALRRGRSAWVSLDILDADPCVLAGQIAAAVEGATEGAWRTPESADPLDVVLSCVEAMGRHGIELLVLDGVDVLVHERALPLIGSLADNLPAGSRVLLTTHAHARALPIKGPSETLRVITGRDLALHPDETLQVIVDSASSIAADLAEELVSSTEGWIAAARAGALRAARYPADHADEWVRTEVADQLTAACLERTTSLAASLLVDTAYLDELSPSLCDTVQQTTDSARALADAETYGCLIQSAHGQPSDRAGDRMWSRHPLLTAGLRRKTFDRDQSGVHRRAAEWYGQRDDVRQTMQHLLAAGDFAQAAAFLAVHESSLYESGEASQAASWYGELPADAWGQRGWHLVRMAWSRALTGDVIGSEVAREQLRSHVAGSHAIHPEEEALEGETALLSAYAGSMRGDPDAMIKGATRAMDLAGDETPLNSRQLAPTLLVKGNLWRGDTAAAATALARTDHLAFPSDILRECTLGTQRALVELAEGRINLATQTVRRADRWLESQGLDPEAVHQFALMTARSAIRIESGDLESSFDNLTAVSRAALANGYVGDAIEALCWSARGHSMKGAIPEALRAIQESRALLLEHAPLSALSTRIDMQEAAARYLAGDRVRAQRIVQAMPLSAERTLLWARIQIDRQPAGTSRGLTAIPDTTPRMAAERQTLLACSAFKRSRRLAESHLTQAADIARSHGLATVFIGCPADLLHFAVALGLRSGRDDLASLAQATLNRFGASQEGSSWASPAHSTPDVTFSAGERELLALLPGRDTNAEIARRLGVSINTVKTRLSRLYRKLGATSRDDALARARQRGVIA